MRAFLNHLAVDRNGAAATQNQVLNALLFSYRDLLGRTWEEIDDFDGAKAPERLPVVCTPDEVNALLDAMEGTNRPVARLLYGSGLRLSEVLVFAPRI